MRSDATRCNSWPDFANETWRLSNVGRAADDFALHPHAIA